jgi:cell wall-associated NlpC family hydrolase
MRIVLPRVEGPGTLDPAAGAGQRIAHQAHAYLGVRYQLGGSYRGKDPWAADPAAEEGASLDCSALVRRVLKDLGLPWEKGKSAGGSNVPQLGDSPDMAAVDSPEAGDLLLRTGHVGIYIGGGELIHAPHSGKVVSKEPYDASKWTGIRRYRPRPAP